MILVHARQIIHILIIAGDPGNVVPKCIRAPTEYPRLNLTWEGLALRERVLWGKSPWGCSFEYDGVTLPFTLQTAAAGETGIFICLAPS